ncbi:galactokinase [Neiella sp. HB171785]|uniref:Galactokinase n=1 Tax=Neiella litorisoli TaxID=2771431 RepID=A0A8J6QTC4_9GAMM|nr:galactokinase [Neiella litorisoli]MBD1388672.1 galactokinase [Neiella litorisoli]
MSQLVQLVTSEFANKFGAAPSYLLQAPGRVNLIGEHTDYNDGFVLPCAINFKTLAAANKRDDNVVRVLALDCDGQVDEFSVSQPISESPQLWANYIRGVVKYLLERGFQLGGADIAIAGDVPRGAGLSSSASLEVVIGQTFKALYQLDISQQDIALVGQQAENLFVGCNCGIMDQLISAKAEQQHASLIDCRTLETKAVPLPSGHSIVIVNSNKKRGLVDSEYNLRREQCEQASAILGVKALRDVDWQQFEAKQHLLPPVTLQRARHVVSENERTQQAAIAMANNDMSRLQALMAESHQSMRDDFEITVPEIDLLVAIIKAEIGQRGGVRMTGGGFGGCVVAIVPDDMVQQVKQVVLREYPKRTGLTPDVFICSAEIGAGQHDMQLTDSVISAECAEVASCSEE